LDDFIQRSDNPEIEHILSETAGLGLSVDAYETAFQAIVTDIEKRSAPDGPEITLKTTLNELEHSVLPLDNPELYQLVLKIQADSQSFLNTGQSQYYDNLQLLTIDFGELVQNSSEDDLMANTIPIPASNLVESIKVIRNNLTGLAVLDANIEANTIILREELLKINKTTNHIRQESTEALNRVGFQLQSVSGNGRLALIIISLVALGVGSLAAFVLTRRIIGPLNQLRDTAQKLGQGDLNQSVQITGGIELVSLANSFNTMADQIQELFSGLEDRVSERTIELEKANEQIEQRANQLKAITLVGSAITSVRSIENVLPKITEVISQQFGYYQVGIFLNNSTDEYAVLSAANSEGGKKMLERGHQLKIGEQGIVGYSIALGRPRIALDVGEDAVFFDNPELPDTRSEMALPLKFGDQIIGALDVQSTVEAAFNDEDINVLTLLADQVSLAIENARLFDQTRRSLAESETLYRQYIRQAWSKLSREQDLAGYRYDARGATPLESSDNIDAILSDGGQSDSNNETKRVSVPIKIRGEPIGTLTVQVPENYDLGEDQMELVNAVAERVALSAENARLFEEITRRAERERLVSDISGKIRSTNDPDKIIQTAIEELKIALGATHVQLIPHVLQGPESPPMSKDRTPNPDNNNAPQTIKSVGEK
ncbi:MAG: GAF domain-containing protein, partial [Thaumarchaeota archaeon]|nr:GAF domain-containing protein [Nitrososphaerota archaeon]